MQKFDRVGQARFCERSDPACSMLGAVRDVCSNSLYNEDLGQLFRNKRTAQGVRDPIEENPGIASAQKRSTRCSRTGM